MEIEVSVVCLTYNHEKYVKKMLESLVGQKTNFAYEILVHDDASTDNTQKIISEYAEKYPQLIKPILQKENQYSKGINPNIKFNYPRVKGKYIAYCEGDDYWLATDKLQKQYDALQQNESCSFCVHNIQCIYPDGEFTKKMFPPVSLKSGVITADEYMRNELKDSGWLFQTTSYLIRANVVRKFINEYSNCYPVGDLPLVLFCLQYGNCYYLNETMSCYRLSSGGYMTALSSRSKKILHCKKMIAGHMDFDRRTKGKYHDYFEYAILNKEVEILVLEKKYKDILKNKYKSIRDKMNTRKKILIVVGAFFPSLADWAERKKNGWTK